MKIPNIKNKKLFNFSETAFGFLSIFLLMLELITSYYIVC